MFDEGTNAVTMNLPKQVEIQRQESKKQLNLPHTESKYDGDFTNNFIDSELLNMADSLYEEGK